MHKHLCYIVGHEWQCSSEKCECICGLSMEGHDHSDCPLEIRPCPEHEAEAMADEDSQPAILGEPRGPVPHCRCGCADIDASQVVGWCLWCDHTYVKWDLRIQDEHTANHCFGMQA